MARKCTKNQKGFTLIELMTTVAIVGTLAAVGVPQYRKFQRRARRAEANMVLGVVASNQSTFRAEYNAITNSLGALGVELENPPTFYRFGFPTGACADQAMALSVNGAAIAAAPAGFAFPGWNTAQVPGTSLVGGAAAAATSIGPAGGAGIAAIAAGCLAANILAANAYTVSASGQVGGPVADQVQIDQARTVTIQQDGT